MSNENEAWVGLDLDGTIAHYTGYQGADHIGDPIPKMLLRMHRWRVQGRKMKIFTARAEDEQAIPHIKAWLEKHGFGGLEITNKKDYKMIELWDDRAIQIIPNTGERADGKKDI